MPSLQSLRRKIAAVKNTQKITKAMKMVAAAKLKRAQDRILSSRPYAHKMREVLANLSRRVNRSAHPLLQKSPLLFVPLRRGAAIESDLRDARSHARARRVEHRLGVMMGQKRLHLVPQLRIARALALERRLALCGR